jgi:hypothetical protein
VAHPKNVEAVIEWYQAHRPDLVPTIEMMFNSKDKVMDGFVGLVLQGFEAGREFEQKHPEIVSGIGYLP